MKGFLLFAGSFMLLQLTVAQQISEFNAYPAYNGTDLGLTYSKNASVFKIWSPPAEQADLLLYKEALGGKPLQEVAMKKGEDGTWGATLNGDQKGIFYAFRIMKNGSWLQEVPDPYARAVGVSGKRAMVVDLDDTDPDGWQHDNMPAFSQPTDAVIYELHVRDASISNNSGIQHKGKFLGLTETGTVNGAGQSTGIDHIQQLGVTHVHLLPSYDFYSVDETRLDVPQYNWGYDPLNYNVPEGSYSTQPNVGTNRIKEFKQLVKAMHDKGLRVVMDVVYNHTMLTEDSYFNQLVPGYYYRQNASGGFSNATACGNETASERPMMRKFMLESVMYWVKEYHIDGFRFDLMAVHDIETMNLISDSLHAIKPGILLYGEGWTAGDCPLPDSLKALKKNAYKLHNIAVFSDDIRDGIKGSVFEIHDRGFASGKPGMEESVKFGIVASGNHPQVNYEKVNYSKVPYTASPAGVITYAEAHDNNVLWDKLALSFPESGEAERKEMHKLALTIVLTSQGIPFLHAGTEFLRTKYGDENSFKSGDSINAINWSLKTNNKDVFEYIQSLIRLRKSHPAFRMNDADAVAKNIVFKEGLPANVIAYEINGMATGDKWEKIWVAFNGSSKPVTMDIGNKKWWEAAANGRFNNKPVKRKNNVQISAYGATILFKK